MKFEDNPDSNKNSQGITPQAAMDDYFGDMFGSQEEDPLKKLESQDASLQRMHQETSKPNAKERISEHLEALPKRQLKDPVYNLSAPQFDEPAILSNRLSPLIIPATFPKLAPAEIKTEPEVKIESEVKTISTTKTKLDKKTALALLTKQSSKLTTAQKQRLREKLKTLGRLKQSEKVKTKLVVAQVKTEVKANLKTKSESKVTPVIKAPSHTITQPELKQHEKTEVLASQVSDVSYTSEVKIPVEPVLSKNKLPDWASQRFECLLFSVAGLKLAVPLISLGAIYKIEKDFTPLVGRASWFMGLYHHLERNVRVIDTAQWVMPERCSDEVRLAYKFIIRLGGNDWGLACDAVHESIQLNPEQIKWRTERTKREWLFGTVIDHMCALIDVNALTTILEQKATKNPSIFLN